MRSSINRGRKKYNYSENDVPPLLPIVNGRKLTFHGELISESGFVGSRVLPEFGYFLDRFGGFGSFSSMDESKTKTLFLSSVESSIKHLKCLEDVSHPGNFFSVEENFQPLVSKGRNSDKGNKSSCKCKQQVTTNNTSSMGPSILLRKGCLSGVYFIRETCRRRK